MPLAPILLEQLDALLVNAKGDGATIAALRAAVPGLSASRCDWQDLQDEIPFKSYADCQMFLIDGRDHCWRITDDPSCATGVVLTPKSPAGGGA